VDTKSWVAVLELLPQWPLLIIAAFSIAGVAFGVGLLWAKGTIAALKAQHEVMNQRLELARDQNAAVQSKLADALNTVTAQERQLFTLKDTGWNPPVLGMESLEQSNTALRNELSSAVTSTGILGRTLTPSQFDTALLPTGQFHKAMSKSDKAE
jgi:hypothetical protein